MPLSRKELKQFLGDHPQDQLADWLLAVAKDSPDFKQRLNYYVATHQSWEAAARATMEAVTEFSNLQSSRKLIKASDLLKQGRYLLESMRACMDFDPEAELTLMVEMTMVAFDQLAARQSRSDMRLAELQREFASLHLRTTQLKPPRPKELAQRLFDLRSNSELSILPEAPKAYIDLLGQEGLDYFRELLEPAYRVVVLGEHYRHRISREARMFLNQRLMVFEWATITGDVDEQIAILVAMSRNPGEVLGVAEYLELRQRPMDAIDIVRQAYQKSPSPKLAEYLAARLEKQQQFGDALQYRWHLLEYSPSRAEYDQLLDTAAKAGQLQEYRARATAFLAERARSLYIELLLEDSRFDDALVAAREHGAKLSHWIRLADAYAAGDPCLSIDLYFDCAAFALKERKPDLYIARAWALANDVTTFQVFRARLEKFFDGNRVPEKYVAKLIEGGVPVEKLLKSGSGRELDKPSGNN